MNSIPSVNMTGNNVNFGHKAIKQQLTDEVKETVLRDFSSALGGALKESGLSAKQFLDNILYKDLNMVKMMKISGQTPDIDQLEAVIKIAKNKNYPKAIRDKAAELLPYIEECKSKYRIIAEKNGLELPAALK